LLEVRRPTLSDIGLHYSPWQESKTRSGRFLASLGWSLTSFIDSLGWTVEVSGAVELAIHVESDNQRLRIWGDVANHYVVSIQQPEWATGFDDVKDMAITSRKRILNLMVNDKIAVAGFHLPFPAVRFVERSGTSYRWVPAC